METTIVLGPEHDAGLRKRLADALGAVDAEVLDQSWGVAGSQEIMSLIAVVDRRRIVVEAETYVGLSLRGDADVVARLAALVSAPPPRL